MSETIIKPAKKVETDVRPDFDVQISEEKQVILHCSMPCDFGHAMRIWKTTYLITEGNQKVPLLFWEGITLSPEWTYVYHEGFFDFTLIFAALPDDCKVFSLVEEISQPGAFRVDHIVRNQKDVYKVLI